MFQTHVFRLVFWAALISSHVRTPVCSETCLAEKYISMDTFLLSVAVTPLAPELYCPNSTTILGFKHSYQDTERRMLWEEMGSISEESSIMAILSLSNIFMVSCFDTTTQTLSWMDMHIFIFHMFIFIIHIYNWNYWKLYETVVVNIF